MRESSPSLLPPNASPWRLAEGVDEGSMWLAWLVRLRWVAIVAQLITLSFTFAVLDSPTITVPVLFGAVSVLIIANLRAIRTLESGDRVGPDTLLAHLMLDVVVLTGFFAAAGGSDNPFLMLYVIHVAMAALMMRPAHAVLLIGTVAVANIGLHWFALPMHLDRHPLPPADLLAIGQIVAFSVTVLSVGTFMLGMAATLRRQKQRLLEIRERSAQTDRLRAMGTLAAGAAHELNTPLSTLGLRLRRIKRRHADDETQADVEVLETQLDRCSGIVEKLLCGAGDPSAGGFEQKPIQHFVHEAVNLWVKGSRLDVVLRMPEDPILVDLPNAAFTTAFINLLENAREAQEECGRMEALEVEVHRDGHLAAVDVIDRGPGLPSQPDRVGEPFFTTKVAGTGLGVFVARALADGVGGGLSYQRQDERTLTHWTFPESRRTP